MSGENNENHTKLNQSSISSFSSISSLPETNSKKSKLVRFLAPLKFLIAGSLVYFLISSGKLDLTQLSVFLEKPDVLIISVLFWILLGVFGGGTRWYFLMTGIGLTPKYLRTIHLSVVGMFFNTVMPGAVGGDLVKGVYIFRAQEQEMKSAAILTVFLDRVLGLFGLFTVASIAILSNIQLVFSFPALVGPSFFALAIFFSMILFFLLILFPIPILDDLIDRNLRKNFFGARFLEKIYDSLREYRTARKYLYWSWGFSILIQGGIVGFYWYLTPIISGIEIPFSMIAAVVPIGILLTAIPLAPGGLGVGHVAFDKLFSMIEVSGGANIFNVIFLGQIAMNLCGFIPYLLFKSESSHQSS